MDYEVEWTDDFEKQFRKIIEYLKVEWSEQAALEFSETFLNLLELINTHPYISVESHKYKSVRRILVTKQNVLYYRVKGNTIYLLELFDTRQDPSKNKFN
jgi:plasmid stabilization system protein ParE